MNDSINNGGCLSDDDIELLARKIGALRGIDASCRDLEPGFPAGYEQYLDESVLEHMQNCESCRSKLSSESLFYRAYFEPIDLSPAQKAVKQRLELNLRESLKGMNCRMLTFVPCEPSSEETLSLAAATEPAADRSMLYAEKDEEGDLIFKKERDPASGKESCYLIGGDTRVTRNAELLIDGEYCKSDERGRVVFEGAIPKLSEETVIIVFPGSVRGR
jgi:hypothetical protein